MRRMGKLIVAVSLPFLVAGCPAMMAVMLPGMGGGHSAGANHGGGEAPAPEKKGEQARETEPPRESPPAPQ